MQIVPYCLFFIMTNLDTAICTMIMIATNANTHTRLSSM